MIRAFNCKQAEALTKKCRVNPADLFIKFFSVMRQYLIDELSCLEQDNIEHYLKRSLKKSAVAGVYWLEVPQNLLASPQLAHSDCGPFYCSVMLEKNELRAEFLVRSSHNMHCSCIAWATAEQRQFVLDFIDTLLKEELLH